MDIQTSIQSVEQRAFAARKTMAEVCAEAGILPQVWSRAKSKQAISVVTLRNVESALAKIESQSA